MAIIGLFRLGAVEPGNANGAILEQIEAAKHKVVDLQPWGLALDGIEAPQRLRTAIKRNLPSFDVALILMARNNIGTIPIGRLWASLLSAGFNTLTVGGIGQQTVFVSPNNALNWGRTATQTEAYGGGNALNVAFNHPVGRGWSELPANIFERLEVISTNPPVVPLAVAQGDGEIQAFAAEWLATFPGYRGKVRWVHYSASYTPPPGAFISSAVSWLTPAGLSMGKVLIVGGVVAAVAAVVKSRR